MGTRFPSLCNAYDEDLRKLFREVAVHQGKEDLIKEGVYVCQSGPCFETPAECNFLRLIGCDAAGMSTVNEVVACRHLNMKVFAISLITNIVPPCVESLSLERDARSEGLRCSESPGSEYP